MNYGKNVMILNSSAKMPSKPFQTREGGGGGGEEE